MQYVTEDRSRHTSRRTITRNSKVNYDAPCTVKVGNHLHNELLTQQGASDTRISYVLEVLKAALEVFTVCQYTQAGRPPLLVCLGNLPQHQASRNIAASEAEAHMQKCGYKQSHRRMQQELMLQ